ncbi:hypothetical protein IWX90DRAFT_436044 [Phyllosticta citrichinensis]|uniref:DUF3844 domain-containing protein n=1 Tax=Phyllosticta citrichinensis TaxID=1130410 RepID=A0ABR1XQZ5_9PEZI
MKLPHSFAAPSLLGLVVPLVSSASLGHVYLHDLSAPPANLDAAPALTPDTARLIFAQRLGLSQYHNIKTVDNDAVQYINDFGGDRHRLFGQDQFVDDRKQVMVVVEGVKGGECKVKTLSLQANADGTALDSSFSVSNPPTVEDDSRLLQDFMIQAQDLSTSKVDSSIPSSIKDLLNTLSDTVEYQSSNGLFLAHVKGSNIKADAVSSALRNLESICSSRWPLTFVAMPPASGRAKRSDKPWGHYEMPVKRSASPAASRSESILSDFASDMIESLNETIKSGKIGTSHAEAANPLKGILPACFSSQAACDTATNTCMGRGKCVKKYTDKDNNNKACFTCKCEPQVNQTKAGTKTTYYGGPACQKKDVSIPFWLFAGFAVAIAFTVSWAIGLLYSMGEEELPSVIGAGVSGPSSRH